MASQRIKDFFKLAVNQSCYPMNRFTHQSFMTRPIARVARVVGVSALAIGYSALATAVTDKPLDESLLTYMGSAAVLYSGFTASMMYKYRTKNSQKQKVDDSPKP